MNSSTGAKLQQSAVTEKSALPSKYIAFSGRACWNRLMNIAFATNWFFAE